MPYVSEDTESKETFGQPCSWPILYQAAAVRVTISSSRVPLDNAPSEAGSSAAAFPTSPRSPDITCAQVSLYSKAPQVLRFHG